MSILLLEKKPNSQLSFPNQHTSETERPKGYPVDRLFGVRGQCIVTRPHEGVSFIGLFRTDRWPEHKWVVNVIVRGICKNHLTEGVWSSQDELEILVLVVTQRTTGCQAVKIRLVLASVLPIR